MQVHGEKERDAEHAYYALLQTLALLGGLGGSIIKCSLYGVISMGVHLQERRKAITAPRPSFLCELCGYGNMMN